jgi:murein DD-endopeptidase MepM/ murein hydrolase activator NlpD
LEESLGETKLSESPSSLNPQTRSNVHYVHYLTMGNADSKAADEANTVAPESAPKTKDAAGLDANGNASEEKKEAETGRSRKAKSKNARTPKQKGGRVQDEGSTMMVGQTAEQQVHVNIAMADLMAYLQVVANNSNHLPLTRRDDPELDRTVSTLTSEDYARKSAAFIPSDVRVIGGTFSRYGRVWDLPTTEVSMENLQALIRRLVKTPYT